MFLKIPLCIENISTFIILPLHGICLTFPTKVIHGAHLYVPLDLAGMVLGKQESEDEQQIGFLDFFGHHEQFL